MQSVICIDVCRVCLSGKQSGGITIALRDRSWIRFGVVGRRWGNWAGRYREIVGKVREGGDGGQGRVKGWGRRRGRRRRWCCGGRLPRWCLWGNATDLSLLTTLSYEDIQRLQGRDVQRERESKVLVNDFERAFGVLNGLKKRGEGEEEGGCCA